MIELTKYILFSGILACVIHEGGHWTLAKLFGKDIHFTVTFKYKLFNIIPVPRGIWMMPNDLSITKKKIVAAAGFGSEFLMILILAALKAKILVIYSIVAVLHIVLYNYYAGDASDFQWFK